MLVEATETFFRKLRKGILVNLSPLREKMLNFRNLA